MANRNYLTVKMQASRPRLSALLDRLSALGYTIKVDEDKREIEVAKESHGTSWMQTGQLTALLISFDDVVTWKRTANRKPQSVRRSPEHFA